MTWTGKPAAWALAAGLIFAGGIGTGWMLWRPSAPKVESYAREQKQKDGSTILERKPQADAKPAHEIPKGAKAERAVQIKVQPSSSAAVTARTSGSSPEAAATIPPFNPVTLDLSLIRLKDQSRRVIASSPDGAIVGGVDIPVEAARQARALKWAAGGTWNPADRSWGAWAQRDVGPLVLGADALQVREPVQAGGRLRWVGLVRAGIRW